MVFTVKKLADEPVIIGTFYLPLDAASDAAGVMSEVDRLLESIEGTAYYIGDSSRVNLSLVDLILGLSAARPHFRPEKVKYLTVIDELSDITQSTLKLEAFGSLDLVIVASVEEGIQYARAQIAQNRSHVSIPRVPR